MDGERSKLASEMLSGQKGWRLSTGFAGEDGKGDGVRSVRFWRKRDGRFGVWERGGARRRGMAFFGSGEGANEGYSTLAGGTISGQGSEALGGRRRRVCFSEKERRARGGSFGEMESRERELRDGIYSGEKRNQR